MTILNSQNFEQFLSNNQLVLIDFYAAWCMPCKRMSPILDEVAEQVEGIAAICKIDIDASQDLAIKYNIYSVPTMILFKNGQQVEQMVGLQNADSIISVIKKYQ